MMNAWRSIVVVVGMLAVLIGFCACEVSTNEGTMSLDELKGITTPELNDPASPSPGDEEGGDDYSSEDSGDLYSQFKWSFGGFDGRGAQLSTPHISGLRIGSNLVSFHWDVGMGAWGFSNDSAGGLSCFFVKNSAGEWVGGKFDWISTSRSSRDLSHITTGYNGWSLSGVPNPCEAAFVVVLADGKKRTNVLTGIWHR